MKTAAATIKGFEVMSMIRRGHCLTCKPHVQDEVRFAMSSSTSSLLPPDRIAEEESCVDKVDATEPSRWIFQQAPRAVGQEHGPDAIGK